MNVTTVTFGCVLSFFIILTAKRINMKLGNQLVNEGKKKKGGTVY